MKKYAMLLPVIAMLALINGCSSSGFENDVKQMAKYQCEMKKLMAKGESESAQAEMDKLQKEVEEFAKKMETKYDEKKMTEKEKKEMDSKANKIMTEELKKCD